MANTVGRVLKSAIPGVFTPLEALGSGIDQLLLVSNLNHLGDESNYRTLCSVPGFGNGVTIGRQSPTGTSTPTVPSDFDWWSPFQQPTPGVEDQAACAFLGTHFIHRLARETTVWPDLVLRCRVEPPTTAADKMFACMLVQPGATVGPTLAPSASVDGPFVIGTAVGGTGFVDFVLRYTLSDRDMYQNHAAPLLGAPTTGVPAIGEAVITSLINVWVSFFTTEVGAKHCQAVGITLALEPAP